MKLYNKGFMHRGSLCASVQHSCATTCMMDHPLAR
jgi:hypothetical protein